MQEQSALKITLRNGRSVGYAVFGDSSFGEPIFYLHGFPGSRLEVGFADAAARKTGITLIGLDRPGFGVTSHYPRRALLDWPADMVEVADALNIGCFSILGISGGSPYALACAAAIPSRLKRVGIISGLGSVEIPGALREMNFFNRSMLTLAARAPAAAKVLVGRLARALHRHPRAMIRWLMTVSPPEDKKILRRPDVRSLLEKNFREGLRGDSAGITQELALIARPWGFDVRNISVPVILWHGQEDDYVPLCMGEYHAKTIPGCTAHFIPGQGHFMVISMIDEILAAVSAPLP